MRAFLMANSELTTSNFSSEDVFAAHRSDGAIVIYDRGEAIPMLLRYKDVRAAAKDWPTYSSNAPFRVPIPSEEGVRTVRQLPIETDPPQHTVWRTLVEPYFRRPAAPDYVAKIDALIVTLVAAASQADEVDLVRQFALPLQSRALTYLLGMPESEADIWMSWGTHVFHDGDDSAAKGTMLDTYLREEIARARAAPDRDDFFAFLTKANINARPLSDAEILGITNLSFAGGRDTIINMICCVIAYFAENRDGLLAAANDQGAINLAVEEFVRVISPLTHIGRVCPRGASVDGHDVASGARVSLGWAAANYDPSVFDAPDEVRLSRSPNPHVGFGSGVHTCLGAHQARAILRSLIRVLGTRTSEIRILDTRPHYETHGSVRRQVGFERLIARVSAHQPSNGES